VAGPLFKVSLYLKKMRDGRFDKVYNLRKGDQLIDFYEHFRHAHEGVVKMQQADIERVRAVIAAAEAAGAGDEPAVRELRELLARKEKAIE
jgi:pantothenate kinase